MRKYAVQTWHYKLFTYKVRLQCSHLVLSFRVNSLIDIVTRSINEKMRKNTIEIDMHTQCFYFLTLLPVRTKCADTILHSKDFYI